MGATTASGARQVKREGILDLLREHRRTSRTDLTRHSGLSKATISEIVDSLLELGFLEEGGTIPGGRGRRRVVLEFNPAARLVIGVQIQDDACEGVLTDLDGQPRARIRIPFMGTAEATILGAVEEAIEELRRRATVPVLGAGIGAPGSVDPSGRRVTIAVSHNWRNLGVADRLEAASGLPVVVANRAKVAALGEIWSGASKGIQDVIYLYLGDGLVAGIVIQGRLLFGSDGGAGEIGHVTVNPAGEVCGCGNRGCLHTIASRGAILRRARAAARIAGRGSALYAMTEGALGALTLDQLREAAASGDDVAAATIEETARVVGLVTANLVNTLNPRRVVIGGPTAQLGDLLIEPLRKEVMERALGDLVAPMDIVTAGLGAEAGAVGAAALFLTRSPSPLALDMAKSLPVGPTTRAVGE